MMKETRDRIGASLVGSVCLILLIGWTIGGQPAAEEIQQAHTFEVEITRTVRLNYLLFLPQGYEEGSRSAWPLILFLHGAGERGDDLSLVKVHGIPKIVEHQKEFPFIAVSPQCPEDSWWSSGFMLDALDGLLDEVVKTYRVDTDRIYLTGLSMGGYGTWSLAMQSPHRFAALAPVCGGGESEEACVLKEIPVWIFHGAKDEVVSPEESQQMYEALQACSGDVKLTLYPEAGHDSWTETYDNPELYDWFLKHVRARSR